MSVTVNSSGEVVLTDNELRGTPEFKQVVGEIWAWIEQQEHQHKCLVYNKATKQWLRLQS